MIHLYSGDGKGKTSIAAGMAIRMAGAGGHVIFAQFMKGNESSELNILRQLSQVKVLKVNKEFGFYNEMSDEDKAEITGLHNKIIEEIAEFIEQIKSNEKNNVKHDEVQKCEGNSKHDSVQEYKGNSEHDSVQECKGNTEHNVVQGYEGDARKDACPQILIVLDEITYPCRWNLIDEKLVRKFLKELPDYAELVMTGRDPLDFMIEASDYWSGIEMKRHPYEKGAGARLGVEF